MLTTYKNIIQIEGYFQAFIRRLVKKSYNKLNKNS